MTVVDVGPNAMAGVLECESAKAGPHEFQPAVYMGVVVLGMPRSNVNVSRVRDHSYRQVGTIAPCRHMQLEGGEKVSLSHELASQAGPVNPDAVSQNEVTETEQIGNCYGVVQDGEGRAVAS